jgi:hypothetical protein
VSGKVQALALGVVIPRFVTPRTPLEIFSGDFWWKQAVATTAVVCRMVFRFADRYHLDLLELVGIHPWHTTLFNFSSSMVYETDDNVVVVVFLFFMGPKQSSVTSSCSLGNE